MSRRTQIIKVAALAWPVFFGPLTRAFGNPYTEPIPQRIRTYDELRLDLDDSGYDSRLDGMQQLSILWDGRRPVLEGGLRARRPEIRWYAIRALARIGDPEALALLRELVSNGRADIHDRLAAAEGLGEAADPKALSVLRDFGPTAQRQGCSYGAAVDLAIKKIERPDIRRALIQKGDRFLEYRFLLDDVAHIYVLRDPLTFVEGGEMSRCPSAKSIRSRHDFRPDEYRHICDLLQDGAFHSPSEWIYGEYLVFELQDGRHTALIRYGNDFSLEGQWNWHSPSFHVRSDSLALYIDRAWEQQGTILHESPNTGMQLPAGSAVRN